MKSADALEGPPVEANSSDGAMGARLRALELQVAELSRTQQRFRNGLTVIAFSGDMDKLMAAFMLATGAAAMGMTVSMFFTFWGLTALKRRTTFRKKGMLEILLTATLPSGPEQLGVSKMNMFGLGRRLFGLMMRKRHIEPLGNLIALARDLNIRMVACETAMEMLAVTKEELLEGVEVGGVACCLDGSLDSGATVFI